MPSLFKLVFGSSDTKKASIAKPLEQDLLEHSSISEDIPEESMSLLSKEAVDFLHALSNSDQMPADLQSLPQKDRVFIANNIRKMREDSFEIPMLPHAVIRTQELLSKPNVHACDFVDVIKEDPTLSVELLRLANSSYLGFAYPTLDLQQAITRVGFGQLHGLVALLSLKSRILQGAHFKNEVNWVMELSTSMAKLCQQLAPELSMPPGEAFTLGLLHNVEYLIVLGEASQFSATGPNSTVSRNAVIETVCRLGPALHGLVATSWGFGDKKWTKLAVDSKGIRNFEISDAEELGKRLDILKRMLIKALGGNSKITNTAGFDARTVKDAIYTAVAPSSS